MRAARRFLEALYHSGRLAQTDSVQVDLYGSLALTGKGHRTDRAIMLGLLGEVPDQIDPSTIAAKIEKIQREQYLLLLGKQPIRFAPEGDLTFCPNEVLPGHSSGMRFTAYDCRRLQLSRTIFYSIGGGFIVAEGERPTEAVETPVPYPFERAEELLGLGREHAEPIWKLVFENEKALCSETQIRNGVANIWRTMKDCTYRGFQTEGILPGGLNVRRRVPELYRSLNLRDTADPLTVLDWINVFAIAVNEENAAGGRVVTAPTNGAAGVVPAVGQYYSAFVENADDDGIFRYFLTAGAIEILQRKCFDLGCRSRMPGRSCGGVLDGGRRPGGCLEREPTNKWSKPPRLPWNITWV